MAARGGGGRSGTRAAGAKLSMLADLMRGMVRWITQLTAGRPAIDGNASQLECARGLYEGGESAAAQNIYEAVLRENEGNLEAGYYLGVILGRAGRYPAAHALLQQVVAKNPQFPDALNALGNIEKMQEHWHVAEGYYRQALALSPSAAAIWSNLGLCLREAGQLDDAADALRCALQITPDFSDALLNLAMISADLGRPAEARELMQRCLAVDPDLAEAHAGFAHLLLQNGEFRAGWPEYEWRFKCPDAERRQAHPAPRWDGLPLDAGVLLVRAEQGLGDQIMFASCLPDAMRRASTCIVECEPRLVNLFARSFPQARIFPHYPKRDPRWAGEGVFPTRQVDLGSLPALFRQRAADFPAHGGYLRADPVRVEHWRKQLLGLGAGRKIGISWRGGAPRTRRKLRSVQLADLLPVLQQPDAVFVSLQYGDCKDEVAAFARTSGISIAHWQQALDDYDETAALVSALDLVVSVQTSVVHLAGALGKSTYVMVPVVPEWRYMLHGATMPWYPAVALFRQQLRSAWTPVIAAIARRLATPCDNRKSDA